MSLKNTFILSEAPASNEHAQFEKTISNVNKITGRMIRDVRMALDKSDSVAAYNVVNDTIARLEDEYRKFGQMLLARGPRPKTREW